MFKQQKLILSLALFLFAASASADSLVYVVTDSQQFGTVDINTGAFHLATQIASAFSQPASFGNVYGQGVHDDRTRA